LRPVLALYRLSDCSSRGRRSGASLTAFTKLIRVLVSCAATLETLRGDPGAPAALLDRGFPISGRALQRIAGDAEITPILLSTRGDPLRVGRKYRTATRKMRKALAERDRSVSSTRRSMGVPSAARQSTTHQPRRGETRLALMTPGDFAKMAWMSKGDGELANLRGAVYSDGPAVVAAILAQDWRDVLQLAARARPATKPPITPATNPELRAGVLSTLPSPRASDLIAHSRAVGLDVPQFEVAPGDPRLADRVRNDARKRPAQRRAVHAHLLREWEADRRRPARSGARKRDRGRARAGRMTVGRLPADGPPAQFFVGGCPGSVAGPDVSGERHLWGCQHRRDIMKYMILTYGSQQDYDAMSGKPTDKPAWSPEDFAAMGAFMESFNKDLVESGELVETRGLTAPVHARRLQLRKGVPAVTDGPYAETYEVLAGYWIVECESFDRATEVAARLTTCPGPVDASAAVVDVRPIAESRAELDL
jgi:hypothetical protein